MVINDDNLPLSAIKVLKQDPAIIGRRIIVLPHVFELPFLKFLQFLGKSLFDIADAGACTDASTPITVSAGLNQDLGGATRPAKDATCKFFVEKPASLNGKVTLTLDSDFAVS